MKQVKTTCPNCGKETILTMTDDEYNDYKENKKYIQDIFPHWTPGEREMLITGICPDCWNKIFNEENYEE